MKPKQFLQLLLIAGIWGASHVLMRIVVPAVGPEWSILVRVILAIVTLSSILFWKGRLKSPGKIIQQHWKGFFWVGLLSMALPFVFFAQATRHLPAAYLVIINATVPIFSGIFAALWLNEPFGPRRWVSVGLGIAGVYFLKEFGPIPHLNPEVWIALGLALLASAFYGIGTVTIRIRAKEVPPDHLVWGTHLFVLIFFVPLMLHLWVDPPEVSGGPYGWSAVVASLLILGILASGVAFLIFYRLVAQIGAFQASLSTFIMPLFGLVWGALLLGESLTWGTGAGALLVISSALLFVRSRP